MKKLNTFVICLLMGLSSMQCLGGEESLIDLRYEEQNSPNETPFTVTDHCEVLINTPVDARRNKETLGTTFRDNPIMSKQPATDWLKEALLTLKKRGINSSINAASVDTPADNVTLLTVELDKLYIWNHSMNLHGTIVVKATMQTGSEGPQQQSYRIVSTKLNWINGDSEFATTLNIAASRLINQVAMDLSKQCKI